MYRTFKNLELGTMSNLNIAAKCLLNSRCYNLAGESELYVDAPGIQQYYKVKATLFSDVLGMLAECCGNVMRASREDTTKMSEGKSPSLFGSLMVL